MNPIVSSHGYSDADIFFLSGHPLKEDIATGLALSGHNERTLDQFLKPHGINIKQTYRSLYIKEPLAYAGTNRKKLRIAMADVDLLGYEKMLLEELSYVKPNVIVPLDDISLGVVFPHIKSINKPKSRKHWVYCYRGSILPIREDFQSSLNQNIRIIPTLGPQLLYNDWAARSYVGIDFERIYNNRLKKTPIERNEIRWVAKTAKEFQFFIERSLAFNPKFLVFDIETFGGMLTCIGFCFDGREGCSIPLLTDKIPHSELALIWRVVARLLEHKIPKVNQNIKYDWTILERHGFVVNNVIGDTMVLGHLLYPELPKGLDFYTSIYTDIPYYKDEGKEFNPKAHTRDRLYLYNALDTITTHQVYTKELVEAEEAGVSKLYNQELVPLIKIYKDIDDTGLLEDQERKEQLNEKYAALFESNRKTLGTLLGRDDFNPRSPKQVADLVYAALKFPKRTKTNESGQLVYRTDKEALDDLSINHPDDNKEGKIGYEILQRIIVCRKLAKVSEYINTPLHPDGRLHGVSNLCGTETGRSSFSKSLDETWNESKSKFTRLGRSLQTISKHGFHVDEDIFDDFEDANIAADLRSMFIPSPGHVFIEGDGSQAEARWVAVLAEDYELLDSFDKKPKIHAKTAALLFGIDANSITKDFPIIPKTGIAYYDLGKRIRHAGHYDMQAFRLSQMTHLPLKESTRMLKVFHDANPQIRSNYHASVIKLLQNAGTRFLRTPFGRIRWFYNRLDNSLYKEGLAYIPQSGVSDHTKFSIPRIQARIKWRIRFINEQHDSVLAEVRKENRNEYLDVFKQVYERPTNFINCSLSRDFDLVVPAELNVGEENWQRMLEVKI